MDIIQRGSDLLERKVEFQCSYCSSKLRARLKEAHTRRESELHGRPAGTIYVFTCIVCGNNAQSEIM